MPGYQLSKSTFMYGLQCDKRLYLYKHQRALMDPVSAEQQAVFDRGKAVGLLAQQLFPGGIDASPPHHFKMLEAVETTRQLIANGEKVIYEATFLLDGVIAALDILVRNRAGWWGYEVKSSRKINGTYITDAAIQYYVIRGSGLVLQDMRLIHLNPDYVLGEQLEIKKLFVSQSVMEPINSIIPLLPEEIARQKELLSSAEPPETPIGLHCSDPYPCSFLGHCWQHVPPNSVFELPGIRRYQALKWYQQGIQTLDHPNLPLDQLHPKQQLQIAATRSQTPQVQIPELTAFVENLNFPLHFLDIRCINPAIPLFAGTRPYQDIPFVFSLHLQEKPGSEPQHRVFLADPERDPRQKWLEQLLMAVGPIGDILVQDILLSRKLLTDLQQTFPSLAHELDQIIPRLKDLMMPFQKNWYSHPAVRGKITPHSVFSALVSEYASYLETSQKVHLPSLFLQKLSGTFTGDREKACRDIKQDAEVHSFAMLKLIEKITLNLYPSVDVNGQ